jgi:hypothetical protein
MRIRERVREIASMLKSRFENCDDMSLTKSAEKEEKYSTRVE